MQRKALAKILEGPLVGRIRRYHALEHATVHLLSRRGPYSQVMGRTTTDGFYVYGPVETQEVAAAASEALARLRAGEHELAVHPRCGTNLAVAGLLAGLSSFLVWGGKGRRLTKLPRLLLAATVAVIAAQPLGLLVQERLTTSTDLEEVTIKGVTGQKVGGVVIHKVELTQPDL
ncbi:MAG TPA: hypothetical protein DCP08_08530 [Chloroflexi bacterium]|nr:hypothetical protein [Chloroflexota bacterium]